MLIAPLWIIYPVPIKIAPLLSTIWKISDSDIMCTNVWGLDVVWDFEDVCMQNIDRPIQNLLKFRYCEKDTKVEETSHFNKRYLLSK